MSCLDRKICLCFHVPLGKLTRFHRLHRPRRAAEYQHRREVYQQTSRPILPPSPDAQAPLKIDLEQLLSEVPESLKLD